jgi:putative ABC transport system permease protein
VSPLRRKLLRDARRQRAQFLAIAVTVFLGVTLFGATYDSFRNLEASYDRTATDYRFANLFVAGGDVQEIEEAFSDVAGIEALSVRAVADVPFELGGTKLLGRVISVPVDRQPEVNQLEVLRGRYLDDDGVLVEEHLADEFGLEPGSAFSVLGPSGWMEVTVQGVVASPEYIWPARSRQEPLTSPEDFGVIFAPEALVGTAPNEVVVYYRDGAPNDLLTEELEATAYEREAALVYTRAEQPSNAALAEDLKGFEEMSLFFPILFLSAAAMAAYVMINRLVYAQRPQIGLLLAEGFTRRQVRRHYLGYGLLPGVAGAIPGAVAGALLARAITGLYTDFISVPVRVIEFRPVTVLIGVGVGVVATLVAAYAPARTASRLAPAETMRGITPPGKGKPSLVERIIPPLRRLPIRWRMALRGIERNPRRTLYTGLGVVLSLVLILVSWGMIDTVRFLLDRQFTVVQQEDARLFFSEPLDPTQVEELGDIPGIEAVEPSLELGASLAANGDRYDTELIILEPGTDMHSFLSPSGDAFPLSGGGLVAGDSIAELLGVAEGDVVDVTLPGLATTVELPIAAFVNEPLGTVAYLSRDAAETLAGVEVPATSALVRYETGVDRAEMRAALSELPQIAAFRDAKALYDTAQSFMTLFYVFVGMMLVFGAAMAFALIFNAMSVNIAERTREVGTLMAVGMDRTTISRLVTSENLVVAAIGIPPGLILGYWFSAQAMASFDTDLFSFQLHMQPSTLIFSAVAILVVGLISQWPGLRAIRNLDIARVVKER